MRKIIVLSMITMDNVMQGPGGPEEDTAGGFKYGGWTVSYGDDEFNESMMGEMKQTDYLLGRKTFDIFEGYWPKHADVWPGVNEGTKYVFSETRDKSDWKNTVFLKNVSDIEKLKKSDGPDIQVWGSGQLIQLLLKHDLVDELRLKVYPVIIGEGKKVFEKGITAGAFKVKKSKVTGKGVILVDYERAGEIVTGNVGD